MQTRPRSPFTASRIRRHSPCLYAAVIQRKRAADSRHPDRLDQTFLYNILSSVYGLTGHEQRILYPVTSCRACQQSPESTSTDITRCFACYLHTPHEASMSCYMHLNCISTASQTLKDPEGLLTVYSILLPPRRLVELRSTITRQNNCPLSDFAPKLTYFAAT